MQKKILTLLALLMTAVTGAWADEVTIGENTTTSNITPTRSLYNYSFVEQIYTASEIGTSGTITSIAFHQQSTSGGNPSAVAIYMKHVNKETFGSPNDYETVSASDKVWEGTLTYLDGGGWISFTLDTPFEYNGTDNLLIACHETTPGFSERFFYYTNKNNTVLSFHSDSAIPDPYNLGSYTGTKSVSALRSNIKINIGSAATVNWDATTNTGTFDMPAGNVRVNVEYYDYAELTAADAIAANNAARAQTDDLLATVAENPTTGGTLMYYLTTDATFTQAQALALAETDWSSTVPTAEDIDGAGATVYLWYYIKGDDEHSDTDPVQLTVNVQPEPTYNVTFAEGVNPEAPADPVWTATPNTGVKKDETVTVTYTGDRKVIGVRAEKKAEPTK